MESPVFAGTDSGSGRGSGDEDLEGKTTAEETPGMACEWWHPDEFPEWTYETGWHTSGLGRDSNLSGAITLLFLLTKTPTDQVTVASVAAAAGMIQCTCFPRMNT